MSILTSPISVSKLQLTLGTTASDVVALCRSAKINIWSLCKPVVHSTIADITDGQRAEANYGFEINSYATPAALIQALNLSTAWRYVRPSGDYADGDSSLWQPCRLGDFRGYNHDAPPFLQSPGDISLNPDRSNYSFFGTYAISTGTIAWNKMRLLADLYPCLVVLRSDSSISGGYRMIGWKSADRTFGEGGGMITLYGDGGPDSDTALAINTDYVYLLCGSTRKQNYLKGTVSLGHVTALPALPALTGKIRRSDTIDYLNLTVIGIVSAALEANKTFTFTDPSEYSGIAMAGSQGASLDASPDGHIGMLIRIDNTDTEEHVATQLVVRASQTLSSDSATLLNSTIFAVGMSATMGSTTRAPLKDTLSEVRIPAAGSIIVALYAPALLFRTASGGIQHPASGASRMGIALDVLWKNCPLSYGCSIAAHI